MADGATAQGSTSLTSDTANFTSADVGKAIAGTGIPAGTVIAALVDSDHVTLSQAATANGSGVTLHIDFTGSETGYQAQIATQSQTTALWSLGAVVWFIGVNGEVPAAGVRYQCRPQGTDASGVPIWATKFEQDSVFVTLSADATGQANTTQGSNVLASSGVLSFTSAMVGSTVRDPFGNSLGNVVSVQDGTHLTLSANAPSTQFGLTVNIAPVPGLGQALNNGGGSLGPCHVVHIENGSPAFLAADALTPGWYYRGYPNGVSSIDGLPIYVIDFPPPATQWKWGVVTTTGQNFAGDKTFEQNGLTVGGVVVNSSSGLPLVIGQGERTKVISS